MKVVKNVSSLVISHYGYYGLVRLSVNLPWEALQLSIRHYIAIMLVAHVSEAS
jgi:hypothetical protein